MKPAHMAHRFLRRNAPAPRLFQALSLMLLFTLTFSSTALAGGGYRYEPSAIFPDVLKGHAYLTGIEYLKTNGIITGYQDGTFKPQSEINRAEFTKIIIGALTQEPKGENCFPDVKNEWFAKYVCEAKTRNIISGYPDGNFKPNEKIKFSEASKIVANAFGVTADSDGGKDPNAAQWYQPYVVGLQTQNAIPVSVEFFDENITRDEMAEMVYRLKAKKTDSASRTYGEINGDEIATAATCEALMQRYEILNQNSYYITTGMEGMPMSEDQDQDAANEAFPGGSSLSVPTSGEKGGGGGGDYSTTNVQVEGVDESDIVKNDGKYIYIIRSNTVRIIEAYPSENMKELVSFALGEEDEQFWPSEMYVNGDQLVVLGNTTPAYTPEVEDSAEEEITLEGGSKMISPYISYPQRTKVFIVNIKDRTKPSITRWVEYDGYTQSSRRVGNNLYLVLNWSPYYYPALMYNVDMLKETGASAEKSAATTLVPHMRDSSQSATVQDEVGQPMVDCRDIKILPKPQSWNNLIVSAIPLNDKTKKVSTEVIIGESGNVYSSAENIYIAATDWSGGLYRPFGDYGTKIYQFSLNDGKIEYANKGSVPGTTLNQFSMDEWDGTFRIATTKTTYTPRETKTSNGLYTLNADTMKVEGKLENIAPGENIYSARFMGNRGYVVTFRQVDPLFVIDLKDPKNPKIEGKLKIPGYSTYLHPYDQDHLIGIGNEVDLAETTSEDGALAWDSILGLKLSLFDITDVNKPKELFKEVIGDRGTTSDALYNHKAFLFDKEKNLLAFPVQVMEISTNNSCTGKTYSSCPTSCQKICVPSSCTYENGIKICTTDCNGENSCRSQEIEYGKPTFSGAYAYGLDLEKGFTLRGKVSHYTTEETEAAKTKGYFEDWQKSIQRTLFINDTFYTVSGKMVKANALSNFAEKKAIEMAGDQYEMFYEE